jgi:hypothetical protein
MAPHNPRSWTLLLGLSVLAACVPQGDPSIGPEGFSDDFERDKVGELYRDTGGPYRIDEGWLRVKGARNKPLWLKRVLPRDLRIEFDVKSGSASGDIKVEIFGDGHSKATSTSYTATSYVVVFGGWNNSKNVLARLDEHGADRALGRPLKVKPNRSYHMKIERKGDTMTIWVDGAELVQMKDPDPLVGKGHDHFAFNNWQSDLWFDNLKVTPL